jgi:multidrug efflux pump subunit AcrB
VLALWPHQGHAFFDHFRQRTRLAFQVFHFSQTEKALEVHLHQSELPEGDSARKPLGHDLDDLFLVVQLYSYPGDYYVSAGPAPVPTSSNAEEPLRPAHVLGLAEQTERDDPRDLLELYVRGNHDELIPLASVIDTRETMAPREIPHYDRQRSVTISADLATRTQGEGLEIATAISEQVLPEGTGIRFVGEAEKFLASSNALLFAYGLAIVVVYLVLAAQFESFVHPVTILVAVALSFTGALVALLATHTTLNLFSKIGLVMLVGLVTKNSILIVEFANQLRERGLPLVEAVAQASKTRFRPILMTALATMVGILPIALGRGAGGDSRAPLGIAVLGGMFFSTALTFFIVPATYVLIENARVRIRGRARDSHREASTPATVAGA